VRKASKIRAKTAAGTDLTATLNPALSVERLRDYQSGYLGELAGGESVHYAASERDVCH